MKKIIITAIIVSVLTSLSNYFIFRDTREIPVYIQKQDTSTIKFTTNTEKMDNVPADFTFAAKKSVKAVVHIKSTIVTKKKMYNLYGFNDPLLEFFGRHFGQRYYFGQPYEQEQINQSSGSGVIMSSDGYIVTNNHVVRDADKVEVTLHDNHTVEAEIVGTDPSTDIALIKIDMEDLPFIKFTNSDDLEIGEWVLAVGNPFNLSSTATAGIVSAKARDINVITSEFAIESFIQTDAAVNPGNSGGALLNMQGDLVGINTAIATPTGSFTGYSFAIPGNIVIKVVEDLMKYGIVQRAYLGAVTEELTRSKAESLQIPAKSGLIITSVKDGSAAMDARLREGDIIIEIDGKPVRKSSEYLEIIGRHRPGDKLALKIYRNGSQQNIETTLKNERGETGIIKPEDFNVESVLGIALEELSSTELNNLRIERGIRVKKIFNGKVRKQTNMKEGFIITRINNQPAKSVNQFTELIKNKSGGIFL